VYESIQEYYTKKSIWDPLEESALFCTYFPSLEEFIALFSTDIRTVRYMGNIIDERTVRFLNSCSGESFEIIKLEVN
jgi:hypothetical protein